MLTLNRPKPNPQAVEPKLGVAAPELPEALLRRLELKVIKRLDGFLFGDYSGVFYGPSLDLAEIREYQPGDEVRRMDWNVTARSGKLHVRQYREEREITAWMVVDLSKSMTFGTRRVLKRDLALEFAGVLSSIITRHGDKIGCLGVNEAGIKFVPPRTGRAQTLNILHQLQNLESAAGNAQISSLEAALEQVERTLRRRALLFVVSDFMDANTAWAQPLGRLAQRHDVIAVRVSDPAERELPNVGGVRFRDPESGNEVWVDTGNPKVRAAHANMVINRNERVARAFRGARVDALELSTHTEVIAPIMKFTLKRRGRR
jgi:uncharacterized protein (DUF58 family)